MVFDRKAVARNLIDDDPIPEFCFVRFKGGISGVITYSENFTVRLICEKGEIETASDAASFSVYRNVRSPYFPQIQKINIKNPVSGTQAAIAELRDLLVAKERPSLTPADILYEHAILMALGYSGVHQGRRTKLSEVSDAFTITGRFGALYA